MRKVTFGGANSLDNFLARPDNSVDWLMWSDEAAEVANDQWKNVDTFLMGRKTYEVAAKGGQGGGYPGVHAYVYSRTLEDIPGEHVTLVKTDAVEHVKGLKEQLGGDISVMGGGELARSLFEAGLIDEIGFNIHPVLLGSGIPAFHNMTRQIDLDLIECRTFKNGCIYATYKVKN